MARSVCTVVAAFLAVAASAALAGPNAPAADAGHVVYETWSFKDGAPDFPVALAQTADGYLWVGAADGLYRFDGTRFELFRPTAGERLRSTNVSALYAADGGLWVGYLFGGFSFVKNGRVVNYDETTGTVNSFARDRDGIVWAGARGKRGEGGLYRFEHGVLQHAGAEWNIPPKYVAQVGIDPEGILWVLFGSRGPEFPKDLHFLRPGERRFHKAAEGLHTDGFATDADGHVITTRDAAHAGGGWTAAAREPLPARPVLTTGDTVLVDRLQNIWRTGNEGLLWHPGGGDRLGEMVATMSAANSELRDIRTRDNAQLVDREGGVWFGGDTGVHHFSYSPLVPQELRGTPGPFLMLAADDAGAVWITAANGVGASTLYHVDGGRVSARVLPGGVASFLYRAPDRTLWLGGEGGLWHMTGGSLARIELPAELKGAGRALINMTQQRSGTAWVSFGGLGLYGLRDGRWTKYRPPEGANAACPASGVVITFTDDGDRVWLGCTANRVGVFERDRERAFGTAQGVEVGNVTAIEGRATHVWIGGEFGLQRFDGERFHSIHALNGESLRGISGIVETATGDLWLNGIGGIVHIPAREIARASKDPAYVVSVERFDRHAGLPGLPSQLRMMPTAIEGTDGRLWFAGSHGVVWLDPMRAAATTAAPPVSIQSVVADDRGYDPARAVELAARTSSVQITYAAVSLMHPEAVRFRYRLAGIDEAWHEAGNARVVSYRSLAPGAYRFEVGASDANGAWSDAIARLDFTISPAFYQTTWFRALCALAVLAFAWAAYLLRIRQLRAQIELKLGARLAERMRIARELHDTLLQRFHGLLQQMQAALVVLRRDPPRAEKVLGDAIDQAARAVTEGRDAVQGLRAPAMGDLPEALRAFAGDLSAASASPSAQVSIDVDGAPRPLHPIVHDEVFRIASEALRNAFHHAQAKRIALQLHYGRREFRLRVRDEGKGIDEAILASGAREGHFGLRGMHERARAIGARLAVSTSPGAGTQVELRLSASRAYASAAARLEASAVQ